MPFAAPFESNDWKVPYFYDLKESICFIMCLVFQVTTGMFFMSYLERSSMSADGCRGSGVTLIISPGSTRLRVILCGQRNYSAVINVINSIETNPEDLTGKKNH